MKHMMLLKNQKNDKLHTYGPVTYILGFEGCASHE